MDYKISITDLAAQDLESIAIYLTEKLHNPTAASAFLDAVNDYYEKLTVMPLMFEQCRDPRLRDLGYRRIVIKNYLLIYRIAEAEHTVYILRFFHGSQNYEKWI